MTQELQEFANMLTGLFITILLFFLFWFFSREKSKKGNEHLPYQTPTLEDETKSIHNISSLDKEINKLNFNERAHDELKEKYKASLGVIYNHEQELYDLKTHLTKIRIEYKILKEKYDKLIENPKSFDNSETSEPLLSKNEQDLDLELSYLEKLSNQYEKYFEKDQECDNLKMKMLSFDLKEREHTALQKKYNTLTGQYNELNQTLYTLKFENKQKTSEIEDLQKKLNNQTANFNEEDLEINELVHRQSTEIKRLTDRLIELKNNPYEKKYKILSNQFNDKKHALEDLNQKYKQLETQYKIQVKQNDILEAKLNKDQTDDNPNHILVIKTQEKEITELKKLINTINKKSLTIKHKERSDFLKTEKIKYLTTRHIQPWSNESALKYRRIIEEYMALNGFTNEKMYTKIGISKNTFNRFLHKNLPIKKEEQFLIEFFCYKN